MTNTQDRTLLRSGKTQVTTLQTAPVGQTSTLFREWRNCTLPSTGSRADLELLIQTQDYLTHRENGRAPSEDMEAAWGVFYKLYARKIRSYAFTCGVTDEEIVDCV